MSEDDEASVRLTDEGRRMIAVVVRRFTDGESADQIADSLGVSPKVIQFLLTLERLAAQSPP